MSVENVSKMFDNSTNARTQLLISNKNPEEMLSFQWKIKDNDKDRELVDEDVYIVCQLSSQNQSEASADKASQDQNTSTTVASKDTTQSDAQTQDNCDADSTVSPTPPEGSGNVNNPDDASEKICETANQNAASNESKCDNNARESSGAANQNDDSDRDDDSDRNDDSDEGDTSDQKEAAAPESKSKKHRPARFGPKTIQYLDNSSDRDVSSSIIFHFGFLAFTVILSQGSPKSLMLHHIGGEHDSMQYLNVLIRHIYT